MVRADEFIPVQQSVTVQRKDIITVLQGETEAQSSNVAVRGGSQR